MKKFDNERKRMRANLRKLPLMAFANHPETNKPILIMKGTIGYFPQILRYGTTIDSLNKELGVTEAQREAMINGSMFGWHILAADVDVVKEMLKHGKKKKG